jgi:MerR family copper efflux transcriptional regulator
VKIGEVAKAAGVGVDAVRFYEREGLLPEPARRPSGYREYSSDAVMDLRFIKRAKQLGFSLREISELLSIGREPAATAGDVKRLAEEKLADLEDKIRSLQRMKRALRKVAQSCPGSGPTSDCSILRSLTDDGRNRKGAQDGR